MLMSCRFFWLNIETRERMDENANVVLRVLLQQLIKSINQLCSAEFIFVWFGDFCFAFLICFTSFNINPDAFPTILLTCCCCNGDWYSCWHSRLRTSGAKRLRETGWWSNADTKSICCFRQFWRFKRHILTAQESGIAQTDQGMLLCWSQSHDFVQQYRLDIGPRKNVLVS